MARNLAYLFLVAIFFSLDAGAESGSKETEPPPASEDESAEPGRTFRLFSRRDVGLRLRPEVGIRVPALEPFFSPFTADFHGRDREGGGHYAVAVSLSFLASNGERDDWKAQEFRDFSEDLALGVDAQVRGKNNWLRLTGRHLLLEDRDARLEWRRFGVAKAQVRFNRIPHNFAFAVPRLYFGIGTGRLSVDDGTQHFLQGSSSATDAVERARQAVALAPLTDLALGRNRLETKLELTAFEPFSLKVKVDRESREGSRPWSGSFGLASFVEIPWPIDYDTENAEVELEYAKGPTLLRGSYSHSSFENHIDNVLFDNPWRAIDSNQPNSLFSSFSSGPATGLIDLYPSNEQDELTLTAVRHSLPGKGTLLATFSWNQMEQNDPLVAYTTNTSIVPGARGNPPFDASDPANAPAVSAEARFESQLVHLRWTSRPFRRMRLEAHYRDYDMDNETARITIPGFVLEDNSWRSFGTPFTNLPIAWSTTSYGTELGFSFEGHNQLTLSWENEEIDREFREVEASKEQTYKVSFDAKPAPWVDLRASYLAADRTTSEYDFDQFYRNQGIDFIPALPFLLKFDQAARDRNRAQLMATFYPTESLIVGAHLIVGHDDYPDSRFGVLGDDHEIYSFDLSWLPNDRLSLFGSYSFEVYDIRLMGREWLPFGAGDPFRVETGFDSASNWSATSRDEVDSITLGLELALIPDRLRLDAAYSYSRSDGEILYASQIGQLDQNPYVPADFPQVDDITLYNFNPELVLTLNDRVDVKLSYLLNKYDILDFNNAGFQLVPATPAGELNGGILMGTLPGNFDVEAVALKVEVRFR